MTTHHTRRGSSILPYGLLVGLVAVLATASVKHTGETSSALLAGISERLTSVNATIQGAAGDESAEEDGPLYPFDGHTFTTCGATGNLGPEVSACRSAYQTASGWSDMSPFFGMDAQGIQTLVVPHDGRYRIEAKGARGGDGRSAGYGGGQGARIVATLDLKRGQLLKVAVGQAGGDRGNAGGGGGGGSFVALDTPNSTPAFADTPLVVAAGGGGGANKTKGGHGSASLVDISNCGSGQDRWYYGAGFCEDGANSSAFLNGAIGGTGSGGRGGFGGANSGKNDGNDGIHEDRGGGGGGYRGGANIFISKGKGGLSFVNSSPPYDGIAETAATGANNAHGRVTITPLTP